MSELENILSTDGFMPHGMCYLWRPAILALHVVSDSLITIAYFTIPFTLLYFVRKRGDLRFSWIFSSFAIFIVACGASHVMDISTIWFPTYWLSGGIKAITAIASITTAVLLIKLVPAALKIPSPTMLQAMNAELAREVSERKLAERKILQINASLEERIAERTRELAQTNRRLSEINARFLIASKTAKLGFWNFDVVQQTLDWDDQMFKLYGRIRAPGIAPYSLWSDSLHPEDRARTEKALNDAIDTDDQRFDVDFRILRPDGEIRYIKASASADRDAAGLATSMFGVNIDITAQKRATEQFRVALEAAPTGMLMMDEHGTIALVNQQVERLFGYPRGELLGRGIEMLVPERFRAYHPDLRNAFLGDPQVRVMGAGRELYGLRQDGTEVPIEIGLNPMQTSEGRFVLSSIADITERKHAEHALREANVQLETRVKMRTAELKERESLLQEIHHRVKNNLQVISSLMNLQIRGLADDASRVALRECQSRVMTMAQIHEMLYQSSDYARVPFAKYAKELITRILSASAPISDRITVRFELEEVHLPVAQAIPCGLIVNELVANSLKHAFPHAAQGTIRVEIRPAGDRFVRLAIGDDGIGLSPALQINQLSSLGVQLVTNLVEQLEGELEIVRQPGCTFRVTFPLESLA